MGTRLSGAESSGANKIREYEIQVRHYPLLGFGILSRLNCFLRSYRRVR